MSKRFVIAIVSGVAAAGVMALGAQTAAAATYDTTISLTHERPGWPSPDVTVHHGWVLSGCDRHRECINHPATAVERCMAGRHVALFKRRPGADRKLGGDLSVIEEDSGLAEWHITRPRTDHDLYARARRTVLRSGDVCRADLAGYRAAAR